ncbi:universal stress protein [Mangrovimonas spongiae]|uniref:Universal stress protein n=1 Tax=Mangrovimonas spongiae TaxID=2494697 RepID=A0A3R9M7U1_9FLAO|nr:universal stress protein [Mangrovimonas spongiae]RSK39274.1 universal stress protein [Mangrovimonas spongiae]
MKKIIVPIDFSKYSEYALEAAAVMAKQNDGEVLALHMLELSEAVLTKGSAAQSEEAIFYLKLAEKRFEEFLDRDYLNDVNVTPIVKHFKVFSEVNDVAKEHDADLIVMGSQGTSGLAEIFVGSNTEKVVRHSETPVLVLKNKLESTAFKNVLFATDFSEESIDIYKKASSKLEGMGAKVHLVYVNTPGSFLNSTEMRQKVSNFLAEANGNTDGMEDTSFVSDYTVEAGVLNHANSINADLVAVATHGRTGIAHFFEGSISEDIANHSILPVMTFKI